MRLMPMFADQHVDKLIRLYSQEVIEQINQLSNPNIGFYDRDEYERDMVVAVRVLVGITRIEQPSSR